LDDRFDQCFESDRRQADLLIIIGTSLKVAPVADMICEFSFLHAMPSLMPHDLLAYLPHSIPQVWVYWSSLSDTDESDRF
jgi:hypothetical protein